MAKVSRLAIIAGLRPVAENADFEPFNYKLLRIVLSNR